MFTPPLSPIPAPSEIVFYGDSITQGYLASPRWTTIVSQALGATEINRGFGGAMLQGPNRHGLVVGSTLMNTELVPYGSTVVIAYGVNDMRYRSRLFSAFRFLKLLMAAIYKFKNGCGCRVIVMSPTHVPYPSVYGDPWDDWTPLKVTQYINLARIGASVAGATFVDVYDITKGLTTDSLHPDSVAHAKMAAKFLKIAYNR